MENMKEIFIDDEDVMYRYSVTEAGNVRVIHFEKYEAYDEECDEEYDEEDCLDEFEIVIAKADWYCIAFPDMGTASPGITTIRDYGFVADQVHDAGYWNPDTEAITLAIMDVAENGF